MWLAPLVILAGYYDHRTGEIPEWMNYLILAMILIALIINFGWVNLGMVLLFFAMWCLGVLGGADAKVLMLISAVHGAQALIIFFVTVLSAYIFYPFPQKEKIKYLGIIALFYLLLGRVAYLLFLAGHFMNYGKKIPVRLLPYVAYAYIVDNLPHLIQLI